jgi:hypothetical protein
MHEFAWISQAIIHKAVQLKKFLAPQIGGFRLLLKCKSFGNFLT